jgi:NAD(P)-dependent dehydrogenase (short-subunit alcohol dehydrogenase family)
MSDLFTERVAVVTGGSSGIGRGIARAFAEHGADVVIADLQAEPREGGTPTHERIDEETDSQATFVECDVTSRAASNRRSRPPRRSVGLNVIVNNAGVFRTEAFLNVTEAEYDRLMGVNAKGVFFGSQVAAERMVAGDGGAIINVSSVQGLLGNGAYPHLQHVEGSGTLLTYSLAHEFGSQGIRVNAIQPRLDRDGTGRSGRRGRGGRRAVRGDDPTAA